MIIPYYELGVKKYKTYFWMSYFLLQSCPEYTDPTVVYFLLVGTHPWVGV